MGLNVANFGLVSQGENAATQEQQKLALGQQSVDTGAIGLSELQSQNQADVAARQAGADSVAAGNTPTASLLDISNAYAQKGYMDQALKTRQAYDHLYNEGVPELVHAVMSNPTAGDHPDYLPFLQRTEAYKDATTANLDDTGQLTVTKKDGTQQVIPMHTLGILTGQIQPYRQVVAPGSSLVTGAAGDTLPGAPKPGMSQAPSAEKFGATKTGVIYDQATGVPSYIPPDDSYTLGEIQQGDKTVPVSFSKKNGTAVIIGEGGVKQEAQVKPDSQGNVWATIGNQVYKINPGTPGTPGKSGIFSDTPATPGTPPSLEAVTPDGAQPATSAQGAAGTPPVPGAQQSPKDGQWYVKTANGYSRVTPKGVAPAAGAVAPAPAPAAPSPAPVTASGQDSDLPQIVGPVQRQSPMAQRQAGLQARNTTMAQSTAQRVQQAAQAQVKNFRQILATGRMTADDAVVVQDAMNAKDAAGKPMLTPVEMNKAQRIMAKLGPAPQYNRGGKVMTKTQRYGLG